VVVGPLATGRREAGEHGSLGVLEIREGDDTLRRLLAFPGIGHGACETASWSVASEHAELRIYLMVFEWDARKAAANAAKHGVTFDDAVTVFVDANALDAPTSHTQRRSRTTCV
jgi:hypothetical protein